MQVYKSSYRPKRPRVLDPYAWLRQHRRKRTPYRRVRHPRTRLVTSKALLYNTGYSKYAKKMARKPFKSY